MSVNFGNVSNDYSKYRDYLPSILFEQLIEREINFKNSSVIDLGSGTGIFSRDLVKQGAKVIGIEPSKELIEEAVTIDKLAGFESINYINSTAEDFYLDDKYSIFTAVRAWHWFDRIKVIQNIKKHIDSRGLLIVINSIFLPDSEIAKITFEVAKKNKIEIKPAGSNAEVKERRSGFPVNWFDEWNNNYFQVMHEWEHEYELQYTHEEWCGKIRSVSWMTNVDEDTRKRVTSELINRLSNYEAIINIPHKFSVVVLRNNE